MTSSLVVLAALLPIVTQLFVGLVDGLNFAVQYTGKTSVTLHAVLTATVLAVLSTTNAEGFGIVGAYGAADRTNLQKLNLLATVKLNR